MDVEKQREMIRLWNRMRRLEGPAAEEIRIQILDCFAQPAAPVRRREERQTVLDRLPPRTAQIHRIGPRGSNVIP